MLWGFNMKRRIHLFDKNIVLSSSLYFKAFQTGNIVVIFKKFSTNVFYFTSIRDFLNWRRDEVLKCEDRCFANMIAFIVLNRDMHKLQSFDLFYGAFEEYYCRYSCEKAYKDYWHKIFK